MKKFTNQQGITLIALIITIIVMLILVGVTINVALNGGIFDKAKIAAAQTEQEKIYEEIIASCVYKNNGEINVLATYNAFKDIEEIAEQKTTPALAELTEENTNNIVFVVKGKTGNYPYSITTGKIIKGEIPFVSNDLTTCLINYDKKYIRVDEEWSFIMFNSDGSLTQYIDSRDSEFTMDMETCLSLNPTITDTTITVGSTIYEIVDNSTVAFTFDGETYTFKLK